MKRIAHLYFTLIFLFEDPAYFYLFSHIHKLAIFERLVHYIAIQLSHTFSSISLSYLLLFMLLVCNQNNHSLKKLSLQVTLCLESLR
jgi:hypothetical protein